MRLPCDAVLVVVDMHVEDEAGAAAANVAALLAAWRDLGLPVLHLRRACAGSDSRAGRAAPLPTEAVFARETTSAFADGRLDAALTRLGVTALVVCGAGRSLEATAQAACDLGYRVFMVEDACRSRGLKDRDGRLWSAEEVHALSLAHLAEEGARIVATPAAIAAARLAAAIRARRRAR